MQFTQLVAFLSLGHANFFDDSSRLAIRCLPALAVFFFSATSLKLFLILADRMPGHEKMPELLAYFEDTYIRDGRRPGRSNVSSANFPAERWNHFETASEGISLFKSPACATILAQEAMIDHNFKKGWDRESLKMSADP